MSWYENNTEAGKVKKREAETTHLGPLPPPINAFEGRLWGEDAKLPRPLRERAGVRGDLLRLEVVV
jgi:hypothetical protein